MTKHMSTLLAIGGIGVVAWALKRQRDEAAQGPLNGGTAGTSGGGQVLGEQPASSATPAPSPSPSAVGFVATTASLDPQASPNVRITDPVFTDHPLAFY